MINVCYLLWSEVIIFSSTLIAHASIHNCCITADKSSRPSLRINICATEKGIFVTHSLVINQPQYLSVNCFRACLHRSSVIKACTLSVSWRWFAVNTLNWLKTIMNKSLVLWIYTYAQNVCLQHIHKHVDAGATSPTARSINSMIQRSLYAILPRSQMSIWDLGMRWRQTFPACSVK